MKDHTGRYEMTEEEIAREDAEIPFSPAQKALVEPPETTQAVIDRAAGVPSSTAEVIGRAASVVKAAGPVQRHAGEPELYVWRVIKRNDRMGYQKTTLVKAPDVWRAIEGADVQLEANGYDPDDFVTIALERGTKAWA
jgi:hypothetical protein